MLDFLKQVDRSWTLFLDRDGVINRRIVGGYVAKKEEFEFLPGVLSAIRCFSERFGKIVVVTNQQGVGKGIMDLTQLELVHEHMSLEITSFGGRIDGIYFSADLATQPNNSRKPNIDMALQAKADFHEIDFSRSIMVGDSKSDMEFGQNAGMKTIFVSSKSAPGSVRFDMCVSGLAELEQLMI